MASSSLQRFFDAVATLIGEENISRTPSHGALQGPHGQHSYADPFALHAKHDPSGAVRPKEVPEVQEILRLANAHLVHLWTVSRGKNLGYGGAAPVEKGCVVLDLHRMNRIIEINEESAYAIVEPGVSFFDLYHEIKKRGLNLWPSVPAIGWGSVLGNTLDRGFGYTPQGEHSQSQCGMEVVLPTGELIRTGMGAMKDSALFPLFKGGYGPSVDGLFYQSNLGVVTKIGMHITPAPEAYATVEVSVPQESDLVPLVGILSDLMRRSVILNSPSIANIFRIALTSQNPEVLAEMKKYMNPGSCVPYSALEEIRTRQGWGFWKAYFSLYAPVEVLPGLLKTIQRAFSVIPGATVINSDEVGFEEVPHSGIPTLAPLESLNSRQQGSGHVCFSPILPPSGRELYDWYLTAKQRTIDAQFDFFADFHVYPRYVLAIELVVYAPHEEQSMDRLFRHLLQDAAAQGYTEYRTHVEYMDEVASHFDFNGGALRRFTTLLKDTLDPVGVLSPGKSGIWNSDRIDPHG
ncbi:FAD-linked oxidase-like protein [Aspergillus japonicus CBS 114.51]|uniref:FAD-linked oxidase-like protein n=1 Tax=Aspergillus japonicus CBS 114.51 TaxID=1448312 RepID=A0A8T8X0K8_ASPJA|nr:FAD-linked oxidase-like protein [Aspergillus japonicus CBS 114.51]RAH81585.1 FAD-linked oxidase-like protein [Aspergillus japonicus CBS 114.51]